MVTLDPKYRIPVQPDREARKRLAAIRLRRRLSFLARHGAFFGGSTLVGGLCYLLSPGPSWFGPAAGLAGLLGCVGSVILFINSLGYLITPLMEAELWYFPADPGQLAACQIAFDEGRMEALFFPEYGAVGMWAYRWLPSSDA